MTHHPPKMFLRFFRWYCHPKLVDHIEGDLIEVYQQRLKTIGKRKADLKLIRDVLLLLRPGIIKPVQHDHTTNQYAMFKSYFTIGWRNLLKNKGYSFINIGGLATGMTVAILIGLWVYDEFSYDKNFANYHRIARVMQNQNFDGEIKTWGSQAMQLGPELRSIYGHHFKHVVTGTFADDHKLTFEETTVTKTGHFMEPAIAEMLTLKMVEGTRDGLKELNSIFLSQSTAKSLFGDVNPINKLIKVDNKLDVKVAGIYEDLPSNSSFSDLKVLLPWELLVRSEHLETRVGWGNSWFQCLVQIPEQEEMQSVSVAIKDAKLKRVQDEKDEVKYNPQLFLHPMSDWRLHSEFKNGENSGGAIKQVRTLIVIGAFVLMLACINFINLSTARSERRAKEVGIRKTIGSIRSQLISQFFTESLLVAILAFVISIVIVQVALPWFNEVSGKSIVVLWGDPWFWFACVGFVLVTGLVAGSYPALFLSAFQPVKVLKGTFHAGRISSIPRKVLVVVQFTVSVALIVGTIIIYKQMEFAQNRPIGYRTNGLLSIPIRTDEIMNHFDALRNELMGTGAVDEIAASENSVTATYTTNSGFTWQGKDPNLSEEFVTMGITHDFGKTIGWQIKEGKDFSKDMASDSSGFIVNEAGARYLGFKNPIGEMVKWGRNGEWRITGIARDMVTQSPYSTVRPMIFFLRSNRILWIRLNILNLKLNPAINAKEALSRIEPVFKKYDPANPFEYKFADQEFGKKFKEEERIGKLAFVITGLAVMISCLGLLGLSSFVAEQRTKELGIRKILGASAVQLWQLLSKDFAILVLIACFIAIPLSFYFMKNWLMQYEYRINPAWQIFALSGLLAVIIALITVSVQTIKAAIANPVRSLRSE